MILKLPHVFVPNPVGFEYTEKDGPGGSSEEIIPRPTGSEETVITRTGTYRVRELF